MTAKDKASYTKCAKELNFEGKSKDDITEKEFKCLFKCMMTNDGEMKDGEINSEAVIKALNENDQIKDEFKEKIIADIPKCIDESKDVEDECEKAFTFSMCILKALA